MSSHSRMNEWGSKDVDTFWTSGQLSYFNYDITDI